MKEVAAGVMKRVKSAAYLQRNKSGEILSELRHASSLPASTLRNKRDA